MLVDYSVIIIRLYVWLNFEIIFMENYKVDFNYYCPLIFVYIFLTLVFKYLVGIYVYFVY